MIVEDDTPRYDYRGTEGDAISRLLRVRDSVSGESLVWTNDNLRLQFRRTLSETTPVFDLTIANGGIRLLTAEEAGSGNDDEVIAFSISAAEVAEKITLDTDQKPGWPYLDLYYDLESNPPDGQKKTILHGIYRLRAEVTK